MLNDTILSQYQDLKKSFLKCFSTFATFAEPIQEYLDMERNYKQELCDIFAEEFLPRLSPLVDGDEAQIELGRDLANLFTRKLESEGVPQNLVGWRYFEFTKGMDGSGYQDFARAVSQLIVKDVSFDERITSFISYLHRSSRDGKCGQAATRSLTTFFLFLSSPQEHFFIKTDEVSQLLKRFELDGFDNDSLTAEEYYRVQNLAVEIFNLLEEDGLEPQDMIDVQSFIWVALRGEDEMKDDVKSLESSDIENKEDQGQTMKKTSHPLNQIFYGPPGTGKTYLTAKRAVEICDGTAPSDRKELMARYKALVTEKRISFVCFHQSFSYEDFIEGIRPEVIDDGDESEQSQLKYKIEDGIFKKMCAWARPIESEIVSSQAIDIDPSKVGIYKMSIVDNKIPELEHFCFENNYIAMGWARDVDFSVLPMERDWPKGRDAIKNLMVQQDSTFKDDRFAAQIVFFFRNKMNIGDIVIVSHRVDQLQAIGVVEGEYEYHPEEVVAGWYGHLRKVRWIIKDATIPVEKVYQRQFSRSPLYEFYSHLLNFEYLKTILQPSTNSKSKQEPDPYVLIIDEINRANISKVLGELITLLEPDKRLGEPNEVTVKLPYSKEEFGVPANLHIIGTMNTADRSLALMDTALRRRFEFKEMLPDYRVLKGISIAGIDVAKLLEVINQRIEVLYDREHTIGHAFFMPLKDDPSIERLASIFEGRVIPLLAEYFFEDWQKIRLVLGDNQKGARPDLQFIVEENLMDNDAALFGNTTDLGLYGFDRVKLYQRNANALNNPESYIGIYSHSTEQ